jgi:Glycosyl hydrolase family 65, N-terminal domain
MQTYSTATYCSFPAKACIYRVSTAGKLPNVAIAVENRLTPAHLYKATCGSSQIRLTGVTQDGVPKGMEYDLLVRLSTGPLGMPMSSCSTNRNGTIVVTGSAYGKDMPLNSVSVVIGATTDYDITKGDANDKYLFRGATQGSALDRATAQISTRLESKLMVGHVQDYQKLMNEFHIELYDPWKTSKYPSETLEFYQLLDRYRYSAGISGNNRKRSENQKQKRVLKKEDNDKEAAATSRRSSRNRMEQFSPPPPPQAQSTWSPVATHDSDADFPKFPFPTTLPAGVTPTAAIPWSTAGTVTVTGHDGATHTLTLTATAKPTFMFSPFQQVEQTVEKRAEAETVLSNESAAPDEDPSTAQGDPYVEALMFDYARHLFISSSREDSLPPNLQGVWEDQMEAAWSGDYHANINLQMNHWFADQVGLGPLQIALWNYMEKSWVSHRCPV